MKRKQIVGIVLMMVGLFPGTKPRWARADVESNAREIEELRRELRVQKQLILDLMTLEQQHYQMLLRLIHGTEGAIARLPIGKGEVPTPPAAEPDPAAPPEATGSAPRAPRFGSIAGHIDLTGLDGQPAFVYVEDIHDGPVRGSRLQIVQKNKDFHPKVAVVPPGTELSFPNGDSITHNVFSASTGRPFDLGMIEAGQKGAPVRVTRSGIIEVYCSIHSKMWAQVLVAPSRHFVQADKDGNFVLDRVPVGQRTIVAWTGNSKPDRKSVKVSGGRTSLQFSLQVARPKPHNNKYGQPYGSYQE